MSSLEELLSNTTLSGYNLYRVHPDESITHIYQYNHGLVELICTSTLNDHILTQLSTNTELETLIIYTDFKTHISLFKQLAVPNSTETGIIPLYNTKITTDNQIVPEDTDTDLSTQTYNCFTAIHAHF